MVNNEKMFLTAKDVSIIIRSSEEQHIVLSNR